MLDTNVSLLLAAILFIVLIVFDLALFRFRKEDDQNEVGISLTQDLMRRLAEWKEKRRKPAPDMQPTQSTDSSGTTAESPETNSAIAAKADEVVMSQSSSPKRGSSPADRPSVHITISADIPEGTVVNITMEVVDGQGKVNTQRDMISGPGSAVITTSPTSSQRAPSQLMAKIGRWVKAQIDRIKSDETYLHSILFWGSIIIYALMVGLFIDRFPIYFFTDEAVHMNFIADFMNSGFQNYYGEFLPTFFSKEGWVNGTSVYVQLIPYLLFGKSVVVTRLVSAFITLLGAGALGLVLKKVFRIKYYWAGIFLLVTTPAWFLHARTAFEYAEVGAFYAIFLYFYGRYRRGDLNFLYFAIIAGALCFYTHGLGEILMGITGLALFIVDLPYHIHPRQRKTVLLGLGLGIILLLPFARYYLAHPNETAEQVKRRGSYWADGNLTQQQKIEDFFGQYTLGLNPWFWYAPWNKIDFNRHRMLDLGDGLLITFPFMLAGMFQIFRSIRKPLYRFTIMALLALPMLPSTIINALADNGSWNITGGVSFPKPFSTTAEMITILPPLSIPPETLTNILMITVLFMLIGIVLALISIRRPAHRLALIAWLACPIPASVAAVGMPRMLWVSIPMALLSAIGLSAAIQWIQKQIEKRRQIQIGFLPPTLALFAVLILLSAFIFKSGLIDGPTWFQDYGLYGMQYGALQVFHDTVLPALEQDPNLHVVISPSWANGTEQFIPFFIPPEDQSRVTLGQPIDSLNNLAVFTSDTLFIITAAEYNDLVQDPKFININIHNVIPYPNGQPGFYVLTLSPAANINDILAAQHAQNRTPIEDSMVFNGEKIRVVHSPVASGSIPDVFDNNPDTLSRVLEANPFVIDLYPVTPIDTHSVFIKTGSMPDFTITVRLYAPGATEATEYSQTYKDLPPDPEVTIIFDRGPEKAGRIDIEVRDNISGETSQIHLRTIQFK